MSAEAATKLQHKIVESHWLLRTLFKCGGGSMLGATLLSLAGATLYFVLLVLACSFEGTLRLHEVNGGRGLFEHYGTLANIFSLPIFIGTAYLLCTRWESATRAYIETYNPAATDTQDKPPEIKKVVAGLTLDQACSRIMWWTFAFAGAVGLWLNSQHTLSTTAINYYGNDVWDCSTYIVGYTLGRILLAFEWVILFPTLAHLVIFTCAGLVKLTRKLNAKGTGAVAFYAPDGCGGFRPFGQVAMAALYIDIPVSFILLAHFQTHDRIYSTLIIATALVLIFVAVKMLGPFWGLHKLLRASKVAQLHELSGLLHLSQEIVLRGKTTTSEAVLGTLVVSDLYDRVKKMHTWPYLGIDKLQFVLPLLPFILNMSMLVLRSQLGSE